MKIRIIISFLALCGLASATTTTQTLFYNFNPNGSQALTFSQFDTTLGTLNTITVQCTMEKVGGSVSTTNTSTDSGTETFTSQVTANISSAVPLLGQGFTPLVGSQSGDLNAFDSTSLILAASGQLGSSFTYLAGNSFATPTNDTVNPIVFSYYEGSGTYNIMINGTDTSTVSGIGGLTYTVTPATVAGTVAVTYDYTSSVPEPSAPLLGLIPVMMFALRRRR